MTHPFSEAEIQLLIALIELEHPVTTPNNNFYEFYPQSMEAAAAYFRKSREPWEDAYPALTSLGLLTPTETGCRLTPDGTTAAEQLRRERPPIYYWYVDFYRATSRSRAYSRYCETVFGRDLTQQGFSDIRQIDRLLAAAGLTAGQTALDLGCGNGKITEYISDSTGARLTGIDYIPDAIAQADARTKAKSDRLQFRVGDIGALTLGGQQFDLIISIDSIFFAPDLDETLRRLRRLRRPGGKLAIFYSEFAFDPAGDRTKLLVDSTALAQAIRECGMDYTAEDFSQANYELMQRKFRVSQELRSQFTAEGNEFLYDNIAAESIRNDAPYNPESRFCSRYLYIVSG